MLVSNAASATFPPRQAQGGASLSAGLAGATRIAMRKGTTLYYLLSDHASTMLSTSLGSTSLTLNSSGPKIAELRYRAWGETRYTSGTTPTTYQFTSQRNETSLGLYFYREASRRDNARWYDPSLGRFTSADTIVPAGAQGVQAWDRYAFVNNNPVRYTDPTGHRISDGCHTEGCGGTAEDAIRGLIFGGNRNGAIRRAIMYYQIDTHGASITYDKDLPDDGRTLDAEHILIGPSALDGSTGFLGATIFHETIHVEQYLEGRHYSGVGHWANEAEAYDRELLEADRFGLANEEYTQLSENLQTILTVVLPPAVVDYIYPDYSDTPPNYAIDNATLCLIDPTCH